MTKYIIQDFFGAFRISSFRQNKAFYQFVYGSLYISIYLVCISIIHAWESNFSWRDVMVQLSVFMPMILSYCSAGMHPVQPAKILYLCPMNPQERRNYIYGSYYFRVGIHMLIAILGLCVVVLNTQCDIYCFVQILFNHVVVAVLVDMGHQSGGVSDIVIGKIIFIIALVSTLVLLNAIVDSVVVEPAWVKVILFVVYAIVQLPLTICYVKHIRKVLQAAVSFEVAMGEKR
ncbi:MAG: hypothetical protein K2M91_08305 [Lachnospiraceae bacterium]|nr:hypothetical protein [Lachnospiraceae bacterium]